MQKTIYNDEKLIITHSVYNTPDSSSFYLHAHENYELLYFISGNATFWVEGVPYPLKPNDIMIFRAGEGHCIDVSPDAPYERVVMNIERGFFGDSDYADTLFTAFNERQLGEDNLFSSDRFEDDFYRRCIEKIINSNGSSVQIISAVQSLLCEVNTAFCRKQKKSENRSEPLSSKIISHINNHLAEDITPDKIAADFFISRSYLYSIFKETTGSSVKEYITIKRLLNAKAMLKNGIKPSEVYLKCGFNDYSVFYRAYKAKFKVAPKQDFSNAFKKKA